MDTKVISGAGAAGSRHKRGEATKRTILLAAAQEFASKGFEGASLRAMARSCGLKLGLIQYYFGDKLGVWDAVLDFVVNEPQPALDDMFRNTAGRRAVEILANFLERLIRHASVSPLFVGLMSHARLENTPGASAMSDRMAGQTTTLIELIKRAQADGDMPAGDPGLLFYAMVGASLRIFMNAIDAQGAVGRRIDDPTLIDDQVALCVRWFLPGVELREGRGWVARAASTSQPSGPAAPTGGRGPLEQSEGPSTFYLLAHVDRVMRHQLDQELARQGLTQGQLMALIRVANGHALSSAALARLLEVTAQSVTQFVRELETKGMIKRLASAEKSRALPIEITPLGTSTLEIVRGIVTEAEAELLKGLSFEEREILRGYLGRVVREHRPALISEWAPLLTPARSAASAAKR